MRYIKRKTNVRFHNRKTKHKIASVRHHERNLKPKRVIYLKQLTYPKAKKIFPFIEPHGDIDNDGVINSRDCRPFDEDKQDEEDEQQLQGTPEEQEEASENISNILSKQRQRERGWELKV